MIDQFTRPRPWVLLLMTNALILGYFSYALLASASAVKRAMLPGVTTHGHYQIELDCDACHRPATSNSSHSSENVMQDACVRCHGEQLQLVRDTHPARKFNDPTNAERLLTLDAQNCLTCHREHAPEQTLPMGLTIPADYCWHCHQEVAESRPSHQDYAFDSCATAGCHNYHDNRALYEKFLDQHHGEPDFLATMLLPKRNLAASWQSQPPQVAPLALADRDAPPGVLDDETINRDWAQTAHAAAGVNCSGCHESEGAPWNDAVAMDACARCHARQTESFAQGKHGMRLAQSMSPMTPEMARLPMREESAHDELTCNACHSGHRFDTQEAAVDACLRCHADPHSLAYTDSSHAQWWRQERAGESEVGSGVTCATCHLPRLADGKHVWVNHDQNANLRPNESMAREVCSHCHGLEFSLSALADPVSKATCYGAAPDRRIESVEMAHQWFSLKTAARESRAKGSDRTRSPTSAAEGAAR